MKTKVEYFLKVYNARWNGHRWDAGAWRTAFGNRTRLPLTTGRAYMTDDSGRLHITIVLNPQLPKGVKGHRVMTECPRCHKMVFAGRIHQHKC